MIFIFSLTMNTIVSMYRHRLRKNKGIELTWLKIVFSHLLSTSVSGVKFINALLNFTLFLFLVEKRKALKTQGYSMKGAAVRCVCVCLRDNNCYYSLYVFDSRNRSIIIWHFFIFFFFFKNCNLLQVLSCDYFHRLSVCIISVNLSYI